MKRLIVNADDLGRTHGINTGVFAAHRRGIVTSATAMVNHEGVQEAARLSLENPRLGIGLHVALTGARTALPAASVPSLVDVSGLQPKKPDGLSGANPREITAEVAAQFERFVSVFGRRPTHLDSHHHSHRRPDVFEAVCALARLEGLPVRNAGGAMADHLRTRALRTTDWFEEGFFDQGVSVLNLVSLIEALPEGSTEMMCHPAHEDEELLASSSYAAVRVLELQALCDPAVRTAIERAGVELITFSEL
ncbi:MAG: ChbG/HpnK family deacetylase [Vicinamibacteria bacterium]|nr:ChbG/HpnK family deacetylase [Vicinamibacteria bacterium]